jgi:hypothetical protein
MAYWRAQSFFVPPIHACRTNTDKLVGLKLTDSGTLYDYHIEIGRNFKAKHVPRFVFDGGRSER